MVLVLALVIKVLLNRVELVLLLVALVDIWLMCDKLVYVADVDVGDVLLVRFAENRVLVIIEVVVTSTQAVPVETYGEMQLKPVLPVLLDEIQSEFVGHEIHDCA